jgi:pimeloyl-ACP methyl ester carboxylesterase
MREYRSVQGSAGAVAYLREGAGAPLLLLHGFASNAEVNWRRTGWLEAMAERGHDAIAPDLRGHGRSLKSYDPADYKLPLLASDVLDLLDRLAVARADIIGYSMGARVAAWLAVNRPERAGKLVLGGIGLRVVEGSADALLVAEAVEAVDPAAVAPELGPILRRYAEWTGSDLKALAASMRGQTDTIPADDLATIKSATLVIAGGNDPLAHGAADLAAFIPHGEFVSVPNQDHMRAVGHPAFKRAVIDFLSRAT